MSEQTTLVKRGEENASALEIVAWLREHGTLTDTALILDDETLPLERYTQLGFFLGRAKRGTSFWIGDWIVHGETLYGERYAQAVEVTGLDKDTLSNYAWVARNIAPSRRRDDVPFSCHSDVAALSPAEQTEWLDRYGSDGYETRADWRAALAEYKRKQKGEVSQPAFSDDITGIGKAQRVVEVGEQLCKRAVPDGDHWRVLNEDMAQLRAALGLED